MKNILKNKIKSSIELCSYGASSQGQIKSRYQTHNKGTFARGKDMMEFDVTVKIRCYADWLFLGTAGTDGPRQLDILGDSFGSNNHFFKESL